MSVVLCYLHAYGGEPAVLDDVGLAIINVTTSLHTYI